MKRRHFSTIRTMIPAADYFAVYAEEKAPFYALVRQQCLIAGRCMATIDDHTGAGDTEPPDEIAFMEVDDDGDFDDPTNRRDFLTICHERDITEESKADWTQRGQARYERKRRTV